MFYSGSRASAPNEGLGGTVEVGAGRRVLARRGGGGGSASRTKALRRNRRSRRPPEGDRAVIAAVGRLRGAVTAAKSEVRIARVPDRPATAVDMQRRHHGGRGSALRRVRDRLGRGQDDRRGRARQGRARATVAQRSRSRGSRRRGRRPSWWTFPITAFRVTPRRRETSTAVLPSVQRVLRTSTRSSVQSITPAPCSLLSSRVDHFSLRLTGG